MADQVLAHVNVLRAADADGTPLSGGTLTVVSTGTTTPVTIYSDAACTTPLANPVTADSQGVVPTVFYNGSDVLDAIVKTSAGVVVRTISRVPRYGESGRAASAITVTPSGGITATDVQAALEGLDARITDAAEGVPRWAAYGGTANAITLTTGVSLTAYATGLTLFFKATAANTGAATINVDGLGAKTALTSAGATLPAGWIGLNQVMEASYDGTNFLVQPAQSYLDATLRMVPLGTLTTTSGASQTLSSLVLTSYRSLVFVLNGVSTTTATTASLAVGGVTITGAQNAAYLFNGHGWVHLPTGTLTCATSGAGAAIQGGTSTITTASTSISFSTSDGAFDAGTIEVMGVP